MTPMKKLVAAVTAYGMLLSSVLPAFAGSCQTLVRHALRTPAVL